MKSRGEVRRILDELPDDASLDEIQYRIDVRQKVERGLTDLDEGRVLSHEEVMSLLEIRPSVADL